MMNYLLAKEIYGLTPWLMDSHSFKAMSSILKDAQNGVKFEAKEQKLNSISILNIESKTQIIQSEYQLDNNLDFEGVAVVNLNGPITKSGGASSFGMEQLSAQMLSMSRDERVKGFIIATDSGGGSSAAVDMMIDTINQIKKDKPVYALITKGGMAASAAYGIISAADMIFSESDMNIVGSIGTMIQFEGRKANTESKDGVKSIRLYATKSKLKNFAFEEALNNDNYKVIVNELLDPINEHFISRIKENRKAVENIAFDNGATHLSKDVVGSLIDGISSFSEVVQMIVSTKKGVSIKNSNINSKTNTMTKQELLQSHPDVYNSILNEGVMSERDRNGAWMAHVDTDSKAVAEGISSGLGLSQTQREAFFVKQNSKLKANTLKSDSAPDLIVEASEGIINQETKDAQEVEAAFGFELK